MAKTTKSILHGLIGAFCLTIGLWVITGRETDRGPNSFAKGLPHLGSELGATVGNNVLWDAMEPDDVDHQEIGRFGCGREFGEGNVVDCFGKTVDQGQDGVVALGLGETGNKVQGNMGPRSTGDG